MGLAHSDLSEISGRLLDSEREGKGREAERRERVRRGGRERELVGALSPFNYNGLHQD